MQRRAGHGDTALTPSAPLFPHRPSEVPAVDCHCFSMPQHNLFFLFSAEQRDIALFITP
jgi:hypothetical protein